MKRFFEGSLCGFLNGFFGSGGGVLAVPVLEREGCSVKEAHATSVALIFVLSLVTAVSYGVTGGLDFGAYLQGLQAMGYQGTLGVEGNLHTSLEADLQRTAETLLRAAGTL